MVTSILLEDKSISNFEKALVELEKKSQAIIILSCDKNQFSPLLLDPILKGCSTPIIGGIFPSIVYKNKLYHEGTILLGLNTPIETTILPHISENYDYDAVIEKEMGELHPDTNTMFLFFDALSKNIDIIIQSIFNNYGLTINYIGGSAVGENFENKPVIFSNQGLLEDAAILATTTAKSTIGVKHGWEPLNDETYMITKANKNIIYEIDYQPAFEVYKNIIETQTGKPFVATSFLDKSQFFPLGIRRLSGDDIVRVATNVTEEQALVCTGNVPENSAIQILHSSTPMLLKAAQNAAELAEEENFQKSFKLYIGCLARLLVMDKDFIEEINRIYKEEELLIGAISGGEIANNKDHYLELYNATAVVAKIADV
jgi:hypothetical protein